MGHQARQITRDFAARLAGKGKRSTDRKVRQHSIDVEDRRARFSRPIGTTAGALSWIDYLLKAVSEWDDAQRAKSGRDHSVCMACACSKRFSAGAER